MLVVGLVGATGRVMSQDAAGDRKGKKIDIYIINLGYKKVDRDLEKKEEEPYHVIT